MPTKLETKKPAPFYFQVKISKLGGGKIKGFASTPALDRGRDIVEPEAFKDAIATFMTNAQMLFNHDMDNSVGHWDKATVTDKGLEVEGTVTDRAIWEKIKAGDLKALSIGYIPLAWRFEEINGVEVRVIEKVDLLEISIVTIPANQEALFSVAKSVANALNTLETKGLAGVTVAQAEEEGKKHYTVTRDSAAKTLNNKKDNSMEDEKAKDTKAEQNVEEKEEETQEKPEPGTADEATEQGQGDDNAPEADGEEAASSDGESADAGEEEAEEATDDAETEETEADEAEETEEKPDEEVQALARLAEAKGYKLVKEVAETESKDGEGEDKAIRAEFKTFKADTEKAVNALTETVAELTKAVKNLPVRKSANAKQVKKFSDDGNDNKDRATKANEQLDAIFKR